MIHEPSLIGESVLPAPEAPAAARAPTRKRRRPKVWTLRMLVVACRQAPAVYLALEDMALARESRMVTPSRDKLAEATGIDRGQTISTALTALHNAGWIRRKLIPKTEGGKRVATWINVTVVRMQQKSLHTEATLPNKKRCIRTRARMQQKSLQSSLREGTPVRILADRPSPLVVFDRAAEAICKRNGRNGIIQISRRTATS